MSSLFGVNGGGSSAAGESVAKNSSLSVFQSSQPPQQQPVWFQNQKKRIIPNHLVPKKKPSFQLTSSNKKDGSRDGSSGSDKKSSSLLSSTNEFNLLSFGGQQSQSQQRKLLDKADTTIELTKYDETINETFVSNDDFFTSYDEDLPPTRSIHDLNNEILDSLANKPVEKIDSFINRDPNSFDNIFNASNLSDTKKDDVLQEKKDNEAINPLINNESAIIVFGYPESLTNQIIQNFKEFGDILEDFETNQKQAYSLLNSKHNQSSKTVIPLFVGKNWIKLTFDNPASAIDALQENGSVFNGILLGVIPYTKTAIEKLQKRSITSQEDIGGKNLLDLSFVRAEKLDPTASDSVGGNGNAINNNKFEMKDGTQFFLKSDGEQQKDKNVKQEKLGIIGNISRYIFGFHEL